ncbi:sensor histidine kinase [Sphingomonas morindae]|uniref:histidine kinase n=1 Tax=Sphingomonas morindae TaxID=1541170 RepID=A0ABY4XDI0_9SPHN|nr:ATP-binding protein [Sphingomonas morindae]USI75040.1 sensor histidine kinase [Sphingomonas morindae]
MGFERRLAAGFAPPAIGLALAVTLLGWLMQRSGFYADKLLVALLALSMLWLLWMRTRRTNQLIARFVAALEHGDLTQGFRSRDRGAGLDELGAAFDGALQRLRAERLASADETRFAAVLADEAPTPMLAISGEGVVHLANKAARRLFRESDGRAAAHFARYGAEFADALRAAAPGTRRVCRLLWNGLWQRAVLAVAVADRQGQPWRILSVQIIQGELDAAEMATQTDLVRVLTHEIMNSLTPVTSLAASAARLLARDDDPEARGDARRAVEALARRAGGIAHFVESYRSFSERPSARIARFAALPWLDELVRSFRATPQAAGVALACALEPEGLMIAADADLLGQVVLNLLKNAGQAVSGMARPEVALALTGEETGRVRLSVSDNGPGVPAGLEEEIFLPFFTTKADGTGVGLSFARQVVLLHQGRIGLAPPLLGGATIQLIV